MSDRIHFVTTKFEDLTTGEVSCGYRIYDSYGQAYGNLMQEDEVRNMTFKDALKIIHEQHVDDDFSRSVKENGFLFNETWIDYDECGDENGS
jgi:hypothetical protein